MTRLFDSLFTGSSVSANGDNYTAPQTVVWERDGPAGGTAWFTGGDIRRGPHPQAARSVAWLIEPRALHPEDYDDILLSAPYWTAVMTHDAELLATLPNAYLYLHGGTRISRFDPGAALRKPDRVVSIVASPKASMPGHKLRHDVIAANPALDAYGPIYTPLARKVDALSYYHFHVAIENVRTRNWFTEALIDCLLTATVPIYWGAPNLGAWFDTRGIIEVADADDIRSALGELSPALYKSMWPYILANFQLAFDYLCAEDWLFRTYPLLFDEGFKPASSMEDFYGWPRVL